MKPTVYPFSLLRTSMMLIASLAFVAGGVLMLMDGKNAFMSILAIGFFGMGIPVFGSQLIKRPAMLTITDTGFQVAAMPEVPWSNVDYVTLGPMAIMVWLRDPEPFYAKLNVGRATAAKANAAAGMGHAGIPPMGRKHPLPAVLDAMRRHHPGLPVR